MKKLSESILNSEGTESPLQDRKKKNITLNSGLLSDLFDNITKTVNFKQTLVKILISSSLFFSKSPSEANEKHYSLNIQDFSSPDPSINLLLDKSNKNLARSPTLTLKQYNPRIFNYIKSLSPSTSNEVILSSLKDPKNYSKLMSLAFEEGGRSSSFVFLTSDEKFIIKTIKKHERKLFIEKILHVYSDRIASGKSRLARILGTFELVELKKSFIIMENILHNKDLSYIFDLKGSKVDRMIKGIPDPRDPPTGLVLKDVNFDLLNYKLKLKVTENQEILVSLIEDFTLLKKMGIMDYSILLGICVECTPSICTNRYSYVNDDGYIISVGIIDFFQEYSFGKVGEKTVKSVFNKSEEISSASPEEYFKRIVKMAADIFK
jgi:1-phosphatidylinositol-4-phosphate 5-kinase